MIGLDTNVLLRLYLADDPAQAEKARRLVASLTPEAPGYVSIITLVELIWTLRNRYRLPREKVMEVVNGLLQTRDIVVEDEGVVEAAIDGASGLAAEIPDRLIALRNAEAGCRHTLTFDKGAAKTVSGMELIS